MVQIEEILQLPKERQIAIMTAIQERLDDFEEDVDALSDEHISFIKERIRTINTSNPPTYTWQQVKNN
jgi:hypothetical protein